MVEVVVWMDRFSQEVAMLPLAVPRVSIASVEIAPATQKVSRKIIWEIILIFVSIKEGSGCLGVLV